jgi:hypothetical protein
MLSLSPSVLSMIALITASTILPPCMLTRILSPTLCDLAGMK